MKKMLLLIIIILIIVVIYFLLINVVKKRVKINNIRVLHFSYTNGYMMNADTRYEIEYKDGDYVVNVKPYLEDEVNTITKKVSIEKIKVVEEILKKYEVSKWNGFKGNDKNVLDGDSFSFYLKMEDGNTIDASGYMKWPENYGKVKGELDSFFQSIIKEGDMRHD